MDKEDIVDGIIDILNMSEMAIASENGVIEASLDDKKFKITVEEIN